MLRDAAELDGCDTERETENQKRRQLYRLDGIKMHEVTVEFLEISQSNDATNTSFSLLLSEY